MKGNPILGFSYVWRGFMQLGRPELRPYVAWPILINAILVSFLSYSGIQWLHGSIEDVLGYVPSWLDWLYWILMPVAVMTVLLIFAYFFSAILVVIASPFNGLLSEKVEQQQGSTIPDESIPSMVKRTLLRELTKLGYMLPRYLGLIIISLIPVVNLAAPFLWFWFGSWIVALQYLDYSFDNHTRPFAETRTTLGQQPLTVLGFGAIVALLMTIPLVNWFVMPAAVIGATLLRLEQMPFVDHDILSGKGDTLNYALKNDVTTRLTDGKTENSGGG
ncbi:sulfate transporter CysZ [Bacterioplanoides sp.]